MPTCKLHTNFNAVNATNERRQDWAQSTETGEEAASPRLPCVSREQHAKNCSLSLSLIDYLAAAAFEIWEMTDSRRTRTTLKSVVDGQGCQMAKFDPFLSLDCARVEGVGAQCKERK